MNFMRRNWGLLAFGTVLGLLAFKLIQTATAEPLTTVRQKDKEAATRYAEPSVGKDVRIDRPDGDWVAGLGIVEPREPESRLATAVAGRISAIRVKEGQLVQAGDVLVELESTSEQAAEQAAAADLAVSRAELVRAQRGLRQEDIDALASDEEASQARAELSRGIAERLKAAAVGGGVTKDELERAERQADADRLAAKTADARKRASLKGRDEDALIAAARVRASEARLVQAKAALERLRIVAPVSGEVLQIPYRVGEFFQPGGQGAEPLLVLGDTRTLHAQIDVDERDIATIELGAQATITADGFPNKRFAGKVVAIANRMGRKNVRTDEPTERIDTKILEVVVELEGTPPLVPGLRITGYIKPAR